MFFREILRYFIPNSTDVQWDTDTSDECYYLHKERQRLNNTHSSFMSSEQAVKFLILFLGTTRLSTKQNGILCYPLCSQINSPS